VYAKTLIQVVRGHILTNGDIITWLVSDRACETIHRCSNNFIIYHGPYTRSNLTFLYKLNILRQLRM
jgi:hypothetical protein